MLLAWRLAARHAGVRLRVRPLLSGRDYHALMHENAAFAFAARNVGGNVAWHPYAALPAVTALTNGSYVHEPAWYRNFDYREEAARGLDHNEDLGAPGTFTSTCRCAMPSWCCARATTLPSTQRRAAARKCGNGRRRRRGCWHRWIARPSRSSSAGNRGDTIIAGFPWFTDWGRDTFIAMRGLLLARGRHDVAGSILLAWASTVSQGMLPNRFPEHGGAPEFNSVDASLWFVIVAHEFLAAAQPDASVRARLLAAATAILDGYAAGTRFGIRMDDDGLLACGVPGVQLTWMDARVDGRVITPRIGKPVEIEALWINALRCVGGRHAALADRAQAAFAARFPNAATGCLYDVVDVDHVRGRVDGSVRPNQILAAGGLPHAIVDGEIAAAVVAVVERELRDAAGPAHAGAKRPGLPPAL